MITAVHMVSRELLQGLSLFSSFLKKHAPNVLLVSIFLSLVVGLVLYKTLLITSSSPFSSFWTLYGLIVSLFLLSRIPYAFLYEDDHTTVYEDAVYPSVSIIIAAKNEEQGIYRTIETCIGSAYPGPLECILIDDGSTDNTRAEMERAQRMYGEEKVRLILHDKNKGKKEAMAEGMLTAKHDVFVFVDSDSYLEQGALRHITEHFLVDPKIGAISGNTKAENKNTNLLTRMQSIQYAISFDIYKACESVHQSVTCCPGCFSAYRREAIMPLVEQWKSQTFLGIRGTFGDDRSLTNFVLRTWDVVYCEKARATTIVPEKFTVYWKQQLRWKKSWIREGVLGGLYMWKRRSLPASISFYIHFTFPFLGPVLALNVLAYSVMTHNPFAFMTFVVGFMTIGFVFSLFVRLYRHADNFYVMPLFSMLFVSVLIWQMPYAMLTIRKGHWGTR
ncbi:MAG: glycosyltransferase [Candidatus Pacebacteria bacterium]|nr:glycosyltransferase [Candidatus Paceibacterota bacterium]